MEKAYAQALQQMIAGGKTPEVAVRALHEALQRSGRTSLMPKIAHAFLRLAERDRARTVVTVSVARQKDAARALEEAHQYLSSLNVEKDDVVTKVDETLIGGWYLEGRQTLVDASYKKHLLNIYTHATHA